MRVEYHPRIGTIGAYRTAGARPSIVRRAIELGTPIEDHEWTCKRMDGLIKIAEGELMSGANVNGSRTEPGASFRSSGEPPSGGAGGSSSQGPSGQGGNPSTGGHHQDFAGSQEYIDREAYQRSHQSSGNPGVGGPTNGMEHRGASRSPPEEKFSVSELEEMWEDAYEVIDDDDWPEKQPPMMRTWVRVPKEDHSTIQQLEQLLEKDKPSTAQEKAVSKESNPEVEPTKPSQNQKLLARQKSWTKWIAECASSSTDRVSNDNVEVVAEKVVQIPKGRLVVRGDRC